MSQKRNFLQTEDCAKCEFVVIRKLLFQATMALIGGRGLAILVISDLNLGYN